MWVHAAWNETMWHTMEHMFEGKHQPALLCTCTNIWPTWFHVTSCDIMWTCARSCDIVWCHVNLCKITWHHVNLCSARSCDIIYMSLTLEHRGPVLCRRVQWVSSDTWNLWCPKPEGMHQLHTFHVWILALISDSAMSDLDRVIRRSTE